MTLRNTIRSFLESSLAWAKRNRDYWEGVRNSQRKELEWKRNFTEYRWRRFISKIRKFLTGDE